MCVQGAVRGLLEELGIPVSEAALEGPLAPTHKRELHQGGFHDVELVQSFRSGPVRATHVAMGAAMGTRAMQCAPLSHAACGLMPHTVSL